MRAIDHYDDGRHGKFRDWAAGRIRHDLRRLGRPGTAVPPGLLEDYAQVIRTLEDLGQEMGRSPTVSELSARSGLSEEQVLTAMELLGPDD
jgi:DNA-directed RNA polymerase specialized sigma subunit